MADRKSMLGSKVFKTLGNRTSLRSPAAEDTGEIVMLGQVEFEVKGLSPDQLTTIDLVAEKIHTNIEDFKQLAQSHTSKVDENNRLKEMLKEKEDLISQLRAGEADDVRNFKNNQSMAYMNLETKVDELATKLSEKEEEVVQLSNEKTVQSQKITLLNLKCEEKAAEVEQKENDITKLQRTVTTVNRDLADRQQELDSLKSRMNDLKEELDLQTREAEKAVNDLQQFKNKTFEQIEEQQQVIEDAHQKAGAAATALQEEKKATAHLMSQVSKLEMLAEERRLENDRLREDLNRANSELESHRKVEDNLNMEIHDLRLVNNKQEQKLSDLSGKLLGNQRGLENERQEMNSVADMIQVYTRRMHDANNEINNICKVKQREGIENSEDPLLSDEVDRLEELAVTIKTLVSDVEMQREEANHRQNIADEAQKDFDDITHTTSNDLNNILSQHIAVEKSEHNTRTLLEIQLQEAQGRIAIQNEQLFEFADKLIDPKHSDATDILNNHIMSEGSLSEKLDSLKLQFEELLGRNEIESQQQNEFVELIVNPTGQMLKEAHEKEVTTQNEILKQLTTQELESEESSARHNIENEEHLNSNDIFLKLSNDFQNILSNKGIELDELTKRHSIEDDESREFNKLLSELSGDVRDLYATANNNKINTINLLELQRQEDDERTGISNDQTTEFENLIAAPEHRELQKLLSENSISNNKLLQEIAQRELSDLESQARSQIESEQEDEFKKCVLIPLCENLENMVTDKDTTASQQNQQQQLFNEENSDRNDISDLQEVEFGELNKQTRDELQKLLSEHSSSEQKLTEEVSQMGVLADEAQQRSKIEAEEEKQMKELILAPLQDSMLQLISEKSIAEEQQYQQQNHFDDENSSRNDISDLQETEFSDINNQARDDLQKLLTNKLNSEQKLSNELQINNLMAEETAGRNEIENDSQEDFNSLIGNPVMSDLTEMLESHKSSEDSLRDKLALVDLMQLESNSRNELQNDEDEEFNSFIRFPERSQLSDITKAKELELMSKLNDHQLQQQEVLERARITSEEDSEFANEFLRPAKAAIETMLMRSSLENNEQPERKEIEREEVAAFQKLLSSAASDEKQLLELQSTAAKNAKILLRELEEEEEKERQFVCLESLFETTAPLLCLTDELVDRNHIRDLEEIEVENIERQMREAQQQFDISKLLREEEENRDEIIALQQHTWDTTESGLKMLNSHVGMFVVSNALMDLMSEEAVGRQGIEDEEKNSKWDLLKEELITDLHRTAEKRAEDYAAARVEAQELGDELEKLGNAHRKLCDDSNMTEAILRCELKEARGRQMAQSEEDAEFRYIETQIENSATELQKSSEENVRVISDKLGDTRDDEVKQRDIIMCHEVYEFTELLMLREPRERGSVRMDEASTRTPLDLINKLLLLLHSNKVKFEQQLADDREKYEKEIADALTGEEKLGRQDIRDFEESEWNQLLRTSSYSTADATQKEKGRHQGERSDVTRAEVFSRDDILKQEDRDYQNILQQHFRTCSPIIQNDETRQRSELTSNALKDMKSLADDYKNIKSTIEGNQQRRSRQLRDINEEETFEREEVESMEETEWELLMSDIADSALTASDNERRRARADEEKRRQQAIQNEKARLAKEASRSKVTAYMGLEISEGIIVGRTAEYAGERITREGEVMDHEGVKVFDVSVGGPAYIAGIEPDDLITQYNGRPVSTLLEFKACSRKSKPGDDIQLIIVKHDSVVPEEVIVHTEIVDENMFEPGNRRTLGYKVPIITRLHQDASMASMSSIPQRSHQDLSKH